jgi:hypothetical protein
MLKNVVRWAPFSRFAEQHNRGASEFENGLLLAAMKSGLTRMDLDNTADRHGADFNKRELSKSFCFKNVYLTLIAQQNVWLILQGVPVVPEMSEPRFELFSNRTAWRAREQRLERHYECTCYHPLFLFKRQAQ